MRLFVATALILMPAGAIAAPAPTVSKANMAAFTKDRCDDQTVQHADGEKGKMPQARTLNEFPGANLQLAVQQEVEDCIEPVVVRQNVGGTAPEPPSRDARQDWQAPAAKPL